MTIIAITVALLVAGLGSIVVADSFTDPITQTGEDLVWALPPPPGDEWIGVEAVDLENDGVSELVVASQDAVSLLDGASGQPRWVTPVGVGRMTVGDLDQDGGLEVVVFGGRNPATSCGHVVQTGVFVLDLETGRLRGGYEGSAFAGPVFDIEIADLDWDGVRDIVLYTVNGSLDPDSFDGVVALDGAALLESGGPAGLGSAGDSAVLWTFEGGETPVGDLNNLAVTEFPDADRGMVFFSDRWGARVWGLDGATGEVAWDRISGSSKTIRVQDFVGDEQIEVLVVGGGELRMLDPIDGEMIRTYTPDEAHPFSAELDTWFLPVRINGDEQLDVIVPGVGRLEENGESQQLIWGVDGATGEILWTSSLGDNPAWRWPLVLKTGDVDGDGSAEVVLTEGDGLYAPYPGVFKHHYPRALVLDPATGHFLWEQWFPGSVADAFTAVDVDGDEREEIVTAARSSLAVWAPTLEDLGQRSVRGDGSQDGSVFSCLVPN